MAVISPDMVDAIKVQFLKPIFEDDFVEKGMTAWLTAIEWDENHECYQLFFDFSDFEGINDKYFKETYWPNSKTGTDKQFYTAKEAGCYNPKYSVYFSTRSTSTSRNDELFLVEILNHLREVL